jgi:DNA invertase Pin-like site-specific DNA recombinase
MSAENTCVVYCRVSSDRQATEEKGSLQAQRERGLSKAAELGLHVLYVTEDSESAWILDKRSKFQRVLDDARAGLFSVLIADRMNRFSRSEDLGEYMQVMTMLRQAGVRTMFVDKQYDDSKTGQLQQFLDAYVSAGEQEARRKQVVQGKANRVKNLGRPLPGSWPPYGYVWADVKKTTLDFDPGASQQVMRRIWHYFLRDEHPTLAGIAKALNREEIPTPREYRGIKRGTNGVKAGPRWTAETIRTLLHTPIYWRGDADDKVPAYRWSMRYQRRRRAAARQGLTVPEEVVLIPAYGPAYVSKAEAAQVHARLTANRDYASRSKGSYAHVIAGSLLRHGVIRCGYCGWGLGVHTYKTPRKDGSLLSLYRCQHAGVSGRHADCKGTTIQTDVLDFAVLSALDQQIQHGGFLERMFAAMDADAESMMGNVRTLEATLTETQTQIGNLAARIARYPIDDPASAPLEAHLRTLQETIPGLEQRRAQAVAAIDTARANPALRAELATWFDAWLGGVWLMPRQMQREFLLALRAEVRLWRAEDRTPRAQLLIRLPSSAALLPYPVQPGTVVDAEGMHLPLDTTEAEQAVKGARGWMVVGDDGIPYGEDGKPGPDSRDSMGTDGDVHALMERIRQALIAQGYEPDVAERIAGYTATSAATANGASVSTPSRHPRKGAAAAR